jgi:hypothetical protein
MGRFNPKKLKDVEGKEKCRVEISDFQLWKTYDVNINRDQETMLKLMLIM